MHLKKQLFEKYVYGLKISMNKRPISIFFLLKTGKLMAMAQNCWSCSETILETTLHPPYIWIPTTISQYGYLKHSKCAVLRNISLISSIMMIWEKIGVSLYQKTSEQNTHLKNNSIVASQRLMAFRHSIFFNYHWWYKV